MRETRQPVAAKTQIRMPGVSPIKVVVTPAIANVNERWGVSHATYHPTIFGVGFVERLVRQRVVQSLAIESTHGVALMAVASSGTMSCGRACCRP